MPRPGRLTAGQVVTAARVLRHTVAALEAQDPDDLAAVRLDAEDGSPGDLDMELRLLRGRLLRLNAALEWRLDAARRRG